MTTRIVMIVFSYYPADPRPRREAEALIDAGFEIDMICLRNRGEAKNEVVHGVHVHRLPLEKLRGSKFRYLWEYFIFGLMAFGKLTGLYFLKRHDIVHVHNMPDYLVFTSLVPRLLGARVILDLHDPTPEVFMAKYGIADDHILVKVLRYLERISIAFSHQVITPNLAFKKKFISRGCGEGKIQILMNSPDEKIFHPWPAESKGASFDLMYHGTIVERHGLDMALYAVDRLRDKIPGLKFHVYGDGDYVHRFLELRHELSLEDIVDYHGPATLESISEALHHADLGIVPNKRSSFTEINMPTRIFECLSMRVPVIAPRLPGILDYFKEDDLFFFTPENDEDLARVILRVYENPGICEKVLQSGIMVYKAHAWKDEKRRLIGLAHGLAKNSSEATIWCERHGFKGND